MKLALKISKFIVFLICCTLCLTSCTDDPIDDPIDDPPTEPYTVGPGEEEAFPGIHGEIMEFIVDGDTITVEKINDKYVYQGDVFLTEDQLTSGSKKAAGIRIIRFLKINNFIQSRIRILMNKVRLISYSCCY